MTAGRMIPLASKKDSDPTETAEWLDALEAVIQREGPERAHYILESLLERARRGGTFIPHSPYTAYVNTIPPHMEAKSPGDHAIEWANRSLTRWNALAMVVAANREHDGIGGHIASYQSAATLYDVGFNHFFKGPDHPDGADLLYVQGHSAPGLYARMYLEGRLTEDDLHRFRLESDGQGLSSYPHAWLMPEVWQFATVSMGLGAITAIYQARMMKYLQNRELATTENRKVWCFCGDGEMDEPESLGAIDVAAREGLDNLIFVVNCNLQRLDGPVRGDGKIIQELEGVFRGAGWNVIKVVWGAAWDSLIAQDKSGKLLQRFNECVDGEYQNYKQKGGAYTREHFFGKYPELKEMVARMSDEEIAKLNRGGHDPHKVYAAYHEAVNNPGGRPTVILAKTVKGYGMGEAGEGQNITHSQKKMGEDALRKFRDRFNIPLSDEQLTDVPFYKPDEDSEEIKYLKARRKDLGGDQPSRRVSTETLPVPGLDKLEGITKGSGDREISTTMAFVRLLQTLTRDKTFGPRIVPIVPDEARTFGMEGMFRQLGIYSPVGQLYEPQDSDQLAFYKEAVDGQILEEGITEAGSMSSWIAAATSYANHGTPLVPFYIFYSMFGMQRIMDLAWAAGDMRARGFLMGGTAGRTTLNGEGLQHQDGHSHLLSDCIPNCRSYDPTFGYEIAVIIQDGMQRMYVDLEDVFYYITIENENYAHPALPGGDDQDRVVDGIKRGLYLLEPGPDDKPHRIQLLSCGSILREAQAAATILAEEWDVAADVWSVTSFTELRRDGLDCQRWNMLNPNEAPRVPFVAQQLGQRNGPAVAVTDYMKAYGDLIRPFLPMPYHVLGTDGFGRSDTREALRHFFEVDRRWIVVAALNALMQQGEIGRDIVAKAIGQYGIDPNKPNPVTV